MENLRKSQIVAFRISDELVVLFSEGSAGYIYVTQMKRFVRIQLRNLLLHNADCLGDGQGIVASVSCIQIKLVQIKLVLSHCPCDKLAVAGVTPCWWCCVGDSRIEVRRAESVFSPPVYTMLSVRCTTAPQQATPLAQ